MDVRGSCEHHACPDACKQEVTAKGCCSLHCQSWIVDSICPQRSRIVHERRGLLFANRSRDVATVLLPDELGPGLALDSDTGRINSGG